MARTKTDKPDEEVKAPAEEQPKENVSAEPEKSFEERTRVTMPWLKEDGTQGNGAEVEGE